jgi:hypothetical protein
MHIHLHLSAVVRFAFLASYTLGLHEIAYVKIEPRAKRGFIVPNIVTDWGTM